MCRAGARVRGGSARERFPWRLDDVMSAFRTSGRSRGRWSTGADPQKADGHRVLASEHWQLDPGRVREQHDTGIVRIR
jgi:hypothetical protein